MSDPIDASTLAFDVIYGPLTITLDRAQYEAFRDAVEHTTRPTWYEFPATRVLIGPGIPIAVVPHVDGSRITGFDYRESQPATVLID